MHVIVRIAVVASIVGSACQAEPGETGATEATEATVTGDPPDPATTTSGADPGTTVEPTGGITGSASTDIAPSTR